MSTPTEIVRWYEQGSNERANFDNIADEIRRFMDPHGPNIQTKDAPGQRRAIEIFDNTAGWAGHLFSQFVQGAACNPAMKWYSLQHPNVELNRNGEVAQWNSIATDQGLALKHDSFYGPVGQCINEWAFYGNAPMLVEEVPQKRPGLKRIRYTAVPFGSYVMFEGDDGKIDRFIRSLELPAYIAVNLGDVSDDIKKSMEKTPTKKFEILHSIMPRDAYEKKDIETSTDMPYESCWVEKKSKKLIKESGYRKFPVAIARHTLIAGETYARGRAELALPDARSLNQADQKALLKWDRELDPPTLTKSGTIVGGILDKRAGGNSMVRDVNGVRPLFEGSNWQAHDTMAQRKEQSVLRVFAVNEIVQLLSRERPEMTAFEWDGRIKLLQQILGPVYHLLEADFFSVIIDIELDIMLNIPGMLPALPAELERFGAHMAVYNGPLSKAQRQNEIQDIQQSMADIAGMQPLYAEAPLLIDGEKVIRKLFEIRGTQDVLRNETEFKESVDAYANAKNAEKMAGLLAGGAEALGKAAPGLKVLKDEAMGNRQAA